MIGVVVVEEMCGCCEVDQVVGEDASKSRAGLGLYELTREFTEDVRIEVKRMERSGRDRKLNTEYAIEGEV